MVSYPTRLVRGKFQEDFGLVGGKYIIMFFFVSSRVKLDIQEEEEHPNRDNREIRPLPLSRWKVLVVIE